MPFYKKREEEVFTQWADTIYDPSNDADLNKPAIIKDIFETVWESGVWH